MAVLCWAAGTLLSGNLRKRSPDGVLSSGAATVDYFNHVVPTLGSKAVDRFVRLYMVPGMAHSGGPGLPNAPTGPGRNRFRALLRWVEQGTPPGAIIATNGVRSRPLCPYPQVAVYDGRPSLDDAGSFSCKLQIVK